MTTINPSTRQSTVQPPASSLAAQPLTTDALLSPPTGGYPGGPEALANLQPTLLDLPAATVSTFRANVPTAVANALRMSRAYAEDRPLFAAAFNPAGFDPAEYDDIEQRALALWQADIQLRLLIDPRESLPHLLAEAVPLRRKLLRAAIYLWEADPDLSDQVSDIRKGQGHLDLADDLTTLAALFTSHWEGAQGRSDVTADDLVRARSLGLSMAHALTRSGGGDGVDAARDMRDRAGHHLRVAVDRVHAAARYVFRDVPDHLDAYPLLFKSRKRRPRPVTVDASPDTTPADTDTPAGPNTPDPSPTLPSA